MRMPMQRNFVHGAVLWDVFLRMIIPAEEILPQEYAEYLTCVLKPIRKLHEFCQIEMPMR